MSSRHSRKVSPLGRRSGPPERASTGHFGFSHNDKYDSSGNWDNYASPRSSAERVIPVSSETFFNGVSVSNSRTQPAHDQYNDYARRFNSISSEELERQASLNSSSNRLRASIIQNTIDRPSSPRAKTKHDKDYHTTAATSNSHRKEHKKIYSIDGGKPTRILENYEKTGKEYNGSERKNNRDFRNYSLGGHSKYTNVDEVGGYEYTDARGMFRDTEPRWRPRRRGSVDAADRARPISMVDSNFRVHNRDTGPPPVITGFERVTNGVARHGSLRDDVRIGHVERDQDYEYYSQDDTYNVRPRISSGRGNVLYDSRPDIQTPPRDSSDSLLETKGITRKFEDHEVVSRGFGIRAPITEPDASHDEALDRRTSHSNDSMQSMSPRRDLTTEKQRADYRANLEARGRERYVERERNSPRDKNKNLAKHDRDVEANAHSEGRRDHLQEGDNTRDHDVMHSDDFRHSRDQRTDSNYEFERYGKSRDGKRRNYYDEDADEHAKAINLSITPINAGGAIGNSSYVVNSSDESFEKENPSGGDSSNIKRKGDMYDSGDETSARERHYVRKEDYVHADTRQLAAKQDTAQHSLSAEEEYRRRIQKELERSKLPRQNDTSYSIAGHDEAFARHTRSDKFLDENKRRGDSEERSKGQDVRDQHGGKVDLSYDIGSEGEVNVYEDKKLRSLPQIKERHDGVTDGPITNEPVQAIESRENRVRIVEPPKEKEMPKGILRKPTERFPEDPNPIREGVAPLKDATKKGVPPGARWTKIDRKLVNPEALEEAKERFEERQDCVIVLRVLTREEIQKFANRTQEIRGERHERDFNDKKYRHGRNKSRREHDGISDDNSEDEEQDKPRQIGWH